MAEFAHHIGWLRPIEERLRKGGIVEREREQFLRTCAQILSQNPSSELAMRIRTQLMETRETGESLHGPENHEEQKRRLSSAVTKAVGLGIVREEVVAAAQQTDRVCYVISSGHLHPDPAKENSPEFLTMQWELFRLLHLLNAEGVSVPLFAEGNKRTRTQLGFGRLRPKIALGDALVDVHHPAAQLLLFESEESFRRLVASHHDVARQRDWGSAKFYYYVPYPQLRGSETSETHALEEVLTEQWFPWRQKIWQKYRKMYEQGDPREGGGVRLKIDSGWLDRIPVLSFGGPWFPAAQVQEEMRGCLEMNRLFAEVANSMEREMEECIHGCGGPAISYMGKAHELRLTASLRPRMNVHVLTPQSALHLDEKRIPPEQEHAMLDPNLLRQLLAVAEAHLAAPMPPSS